MKKIILSILSLSVLVVLGSVTCFAEPWHGGKAGKTPSKIGPVASQRSECLHKSGPQLNLEFKSSSEEISCVNDDESEPAEGKEKHDPEHAECDDPVIIIMNARREPQSKTQLRNELENYFRKSK